VRWLHHVVVDADDLRQLHGNSPVQLGG